MPCSIRRPMLSLLLFCPIGVYGFAGSASAQAQAADTRPLRLHQADVNCASYALQLKPQGRARLVVTSKCDKITVLVCAFRPAPGPNAWDCQQPGFAATNRRRAFPHDLPRAAPYYVGVCLRQNWDCEFSRAWLYSSIAARRDRFDPRALIPPPPPPPPARAERG